VLRQLEVELSNAQVDAGPFELQRVVDALPVAAVICDDTGAVQVRNPAGASLLEPRIESALVGRSLRAALTEAAGGVRVRRVEELVGPPLERHVVTAIPLDGGGAVAVVQDDSDVARTEAVRRDFVANISHELKTPVGAVALLAEMLADEPDPATAQRFATRIEGEAQRLARSVDDLLELTQIEFGLPPFPPTSPRRGGRRGAGSVAVVAADRGSRLAVRTSAPGWSYGATPVSLVRRCTTWLTTQ
jgi:two-component system sensor histidine kinase SenX3